MLTCVTLAIIWPFPTPTKTTTPLTTPLQTSPSTMMKLQRIKCRTCSNKSPKGEAYREWIEDEMDHCAMNCGKDNNRCGLVKYDLEQFPRKYSPEDTLLLSLDEPIEIHVRTPTDLTVINS